MRRVAITGLGVVSPLGHGAQAFFDALAAGRSGVRRLATRCPERLTTRIGAVADFDAAAHFPAARLRMLDRVSQFALVGWIERFFTLFTRNQWKRERYAPSFHVDDENLDPKTWCRFPILSGGYARELKELREKVLG